MPRIVVVLFLFSSVYGQGLNDAAVDWGAMTGTRSIRPAAVKIPRMYDGSESKSTGVFPDVLNAIAAKANLTVDDTEYYDSLQAAKDAVKNGEADILAVDLENDGIYKNELSFTEPLYASEVVFVKLKSTKDISRISLLDTTDLKETVHAQPDNYPGIYCKLVYPNHWRNDTKGELTRIKKDNVTFMGRNPLVQNEFNSLPKAVRDELEIVPMTPRRVVYPSFGLSKFNSSSGTALKQLLDDGISNLVATNEMAKIVSKNLPQSEYKPPPTTTTTVRTTTPKKTTTPPPTPTTDGVRMAELVTGGEYDEMLANFDKAQNNGDQQSYYSSSSFTSGKVNKTTTYNKTVSTYTYRP